MHESSFWGEKTLQFILQIIHTRNDDHSKKLIDEVYEKGIKIEDDGRLTDSSGRNYMIKQGQIIEIK